MTALGAAGVLIATLAAAVSTNAEALVAGKVNLIFYLGGDPVIATYEDKIPSAAVGRARCGELIGDKVADYEMKTLRDRPDLIAYRYMDVQCTTGDHSTVRIAVRIPIRVLRPHGGWTKWAR